MQYLKRVQLFYFSSSLECVFFTPFIQVSHILSSDTSENKDFSFRKKKAAETNDKKCILIYQKERTKPKLKAWISDAESIDF